MLHSPLIGWMMLLGDKMDDEPEAKNEPTFSFCLLQKHLNPLFVALLACFPFLTESSAVSFNLATIQSRIGSLA